MLALHRYLVASIVVAGSVVPAAAQAAGWQEIHQSADDVRFDVGSDGIATVQHHLRYRVVAGHFKTIDVTGIDPRAELVPEIAIRADKGGSELIAHVDPLDKTPGTVRLSIEDGKGIGRGTYAAVLRYRLDLVSAKMIARDGAMWKLAWTAPPALEGQDGARVVFDLPAAPTEPRLAGSGESTTLTTLRRGAEHDELELVRAHVPRGETATWAVRVDPKAFPRVTSPELRPPPPREMQAPSMLESSVAHVVVPAVMAAIAGALAMLLRAKRRAVAAAAGLKHAAARPLLPLPSSVAPFAYGIVATLALAVLLWSNPLVGACLVALAMALAAHRAPSPIRRPRGPGAWQRLSDPRALVAMKAPLPTDPFDLSSTRGKVLFTLLALGVGALSWALRPHVPQIAIALPMAAMTLVPIFVTGTRAQMSPSPAELAARILRPTRDALARAVDLTHVELDAIVRVVDAKGGFDEVRLACAPRDRTPGLRTIELASATTPGGLAALPEVLLRFDDGSAAADRVRQLAGAAPVVPGRSPEERVLRLVPLEPTPTATAALLKTLLLGLEGRRVTDRAPSATGSQVGSQAEQKQPVRSAKPWKGKERRVRAVAVPATVLG